jgi:hypothetical protein
MELWMAHDSSIFSFEKMRGLSASYKEERGAWRAGRALYATVWLCIAISYAAFSPNDWLAGRFAIDSSIYAVNEPFESPDPKRCASSRDGLIYYPSSLPAEKTFLVIGDSTAIWNTFPGWIESRSIGEGERWAVFTAAEQGANVFDMEDTLAYVLAHNGRRFDAILAKPSAAIVWYLVLDPRDRKVHPPTGSGYSLFFTGGPADSNRRSFFDRLRACLRRREVEFYLQERNRMMARAQVFSRPDPDAVFSDRIPDEALEPFQEIRNEYLTGLRNLIGIAKLHATPIVFLTTHARQNRVTDPDFLSGRRNYLAYLGRYYLAGFQHRLIESLNDLIRATCKRERVPLIDSAAYLASLPQEGLFMDQTHIRNDLEEAHGKFIYHELKKLYDSGVLVSNDPAQR